MADPIIQLVHTLSYGDAISSEVLCIHNILRRRNINSRIFAINTHPKYAGLTEDFSECPSNFEGKVILHYSLGSPLNNLYRQMTTAARYLVYHNLTPAKWFEAVNPRVYRDITVGLKELPDLCRSSDLILADSKFNASEIRNFGFTAQVLELPVDPGRWEEPANAGFSRLLTSSGHLNFLHVGRLAPNKCIEDILKIFYFIHHHIQKKSTLWIVGIDIDTEIYAYSLKRLARELEIDHACRFVGALADSEVRALYENSSCYICMSEHEGYCLPVVEAMSFGLPVLAFASSAISDTVGEGGVLVSEKRYPEIAELAAEISTNQALRSKLISKGKQRVANLSLGRFESELMEFFGFDTECREFKGNLMEGSWRTIGFDVSALDTSFKAHAHRGIGRYVRELEKFFISEGRIGAGEASGGLGLAQGMDFSPRPQFLNGGPKYRLDRFSHSSFDGQSVAGRFIKGLPFGRTTLKQQIVYPLELNRSGGYDLLHFPAHMDAPAWGISKYVITVLDLIPLVLPDLYRANNPGPRFHFARWLERQAIKNASRIIAISHNTAKDIERILKVPPEKISVTHLGIEERFFVKTSAEQILKLKGKYRLPTDAPVLLYVGGIDPRKNIPGLLEAFSIVRENYKAGSEAEAPVLALAGEINKDKNFPAIQRLIKDKNLEAGVRLLGFIDDHELPLLYASADLFVFPSLYEGFGFPPLEAMAAGTPVVSSNTSSLPEILADAALLIDPYDTHAFADACLGLLNNRELAQRLSRQGVEQARRFSWAGTGRKTLAVYEECL